MRTHPSLVARLTSQGNREVLSKPTYAIGFVGLLIFTACPALCLAEELDWVDSGSGLAVARTAADNTHAAYSPRTGKWTTHKFPEGVQAVPVVAQDLVVYQLSGKPLKQLVAVDRQGRWQTCDIDIKEDATDATDATRAADEKSEQAPTSVIPIVGGGVAVVQIGARHYAFSSATGQWDVFVADPSNQDESNRGLKTNVPYVDSNRAMVHSGNRIAIFSAQTGKWSVSPPLATR